MGESDEESVDSSSGFEADITERNSIEIHGDISRNKNEKKGSTKNVRTNVLKNY